MWFILTDQSPQAGLRHLLTT